jgi:hypothetical protein
MNAKTVDIQSGKSIEEKLRLIHASKLVIHLYNDKYTAWINAKIIRAINNTVDSKRNIVAINKTDQPHIGKIQYPFNRFELLKFDPDLNRAFIGLHIQKVLKKSFSTPI